MAKESNKRQFNITGKIAVGMIGTLAVTLSVMSRVVLTTKGLVNIPILTVAAFFRGVSKGTSSDVALDTNTITATENTIIQSLSLTEKITKLKEQIKKDFNNAYKIQEDKFAKGIASFKTSSDRAKDFLYLPKKERLALDRSTRALFLREFEGSRINEAFKHIDAAGHHYSAGVSTALVNIYRTTERCGQFAGKCLKHLKYIKRLATPVSIAIKTYFISYFVSAEVLNSPLGKTLGLGEITKHIFPVLNSIPKKIFAPTRWLWTVSKSRLPTLPAKWLWKIPKKMLKESQKKFGPLSKSEEGVTIKLTKGIGQYIFNPDYSLVWVTGAVQTVLAAKTYVLAPMLVGFFDGLTTDPISKEAIQKTSNAISAVTVEDKKSFLKMAWVDFKIAYKAALKKFTKYDKFFEEEIGATKIKMQEVKTEKKDIKQQKQEKQLPGIGILTKKPAKAVHIKIGRSYVLGWSEKTKYTLNTLDKFRAAIQGVASYTAATSYKTGKYVATFIPFVKAIRKPSHASKLMKSRNKNTGQKKIKFN